MEVTERYWLHTAFCVAMLTSAVWNASGFYSNKLKDAGKWREAKAGAGAGAGVGAGASAGVGGTKKAHNE